MIRLKHDCDTPHSMPVVEEQRVWTCPDCSMQWRWDVIADETGRAYIGIGWVRGERVKPEPQVIDPAPKCSNPECPQCTGKWGTDRESETEHEHGYRLEKKDREHPWWWPLPARWWRLVTLQWW